MKYQINEVEEIIETMVLREDEQIKVLKVDGYTGFIIIELNYTNKRSNQIYKLHISELSNQDCELYTHIKNEHNGKNVARTLNSSIVTDKLIFAFANDLRGRFNMTAYPGGEEVRRFLRFLYPNFLCYGITEKYIAKKASKFQVTSPQYFR